MVRTSDDAIPYWSSSTNPPSVQLTGSNFNGSASASYNSDLGLGLQLGPGDTILPVSNTPLQPSNFYVSQISVYSYEISMDMIQYSGEGSYYTVEFADPLIDSWINAASFSYTPTIPYLTVAPVGSPSLQLPNTWTDVNTWTGPTGTIINGGTITTGTVNAYTFNTLSDYRIKQDVQPIIETVDNLNPVLYRNILTNKLDMGFIAHEVQEYFSFLVTGEKDGKKYQSINYIGLISLLTKEIQNLKQKVTELEQLEDVKQLENVKDLDSDLDLDSDSGSDTNN